MLGYDLQSMRQNGFEVVVSNKANRRGILFARYTVVIIVGVSAFLYPALFTPGGTPFWHSGDQDLFLLNASRMLHGELIYRDFFHFLLPGTETVFLSLFKMWGERAWIVNTVLILLGVVQTWLIVFISSTVLDGWAAALPGLLFLVGPFRNVLDATHNWFSSATVLATVLVVIEERTKRRLAIAGVLCGIASVFTSPRGLMCAFGLVVFLVWEQREDKAKCNELRVKLFSLLLPFALTIAGVCGYLVARVGLPTLWESLVIFPLRYYPKDHFNNSFRVYMTDWPGFTPWTHLPALSVWFFIYALLPLTYILFLIRYGQSQSKEAGETGKRLMLLNIVGCALFCGIITTPSFTRLSEVSPPALILLTWLLNSTAGHAKFAMKLLWIWALVLVAIESLPNWRHTWFVLDLPTGQVAFQGERTDSTVAWLAEHIHPREYVFDAACRVYFVLQVENPGKIPVVSNTGYTTVEQVQNLIYSLEAKQARFILWRRFLDVPPSGLDKGDNLGPLRLYLARHYRPVYTFSAGDRIFERSATSDPRSSGGVPSLLKAPGIRFAGLENCRSDFANDTSTAPSPMTFDD
jgi:hypothetical protein